MLVKKYPAEVMEIQNPVDTLYVLKLRSKGRPFKFLPGQFLHLSLDEYDPSNSWPESRCYSIQGQDRSGSIILTFSIKGRFTSRIAKELTIGKTLWLKMPYGSLFQDIPDKSGCVFIAGGTGITPFLSLFTHESFKLFQKPTLYAGFRSAEYNIYGTYLSDAKIINPEFESRIFYEDLEGMLDIESIFQKQPEGATYFLSGPPVMIKNFRNFLVENGVNTERIRTDEWE